MFGGICFDPMFFLYPENDKLYTNIEESLMVVGALKVSPILVPGIKDACQCISLRENGQHG